MGPIAETFFQLIVQIFYTDMRCDFVEKNDPISPQFQHDDLIGSLGSQLDISSVLLPILS